MNRGVPLAGLELSDFQAAHESLDEKVFEVLGVKHAIDALVSYGSTAPQQVAQQVKLWQEQLAQDH